MKYIRAALAKWKQDGIVSLASDAYQYSQNMARSKFYDILPHIRNNIYKMKGRKAIADPWKTIQVNPDDIEIVWPGETRRKNRGEIRRGSWDLNDDSKMEFARGKKYRAIEQHFIDGVPWEETGIYDYLMDLIKSKGSIDGCQTESQLVERYESEIEDLYRSIANDGYKSQVELGNAPPEKPALGEPGICIGRDGELIFGGAGGWHRVSIAKIADVNSIPVQVLIRHHQWQKKRESLYIKDKVGNSNLGKYQSHPDMADIVSKSNDC